MRWLLRRAQARLLLSTLRRAHDLAVLVPHVTGATSAALAVYGKLA